VIRRTINTERKRLPRAGGRLRGFNFLSIARGGVWAKGWRFTAPRRCQLVRRWQYSGATRASSHARTVAAAASLSTSRQPARKPCADTRPRMVPTGGKMAVDEIKPRFESLGRSLRSSDTVGVRCGCGLAGRCTRRIHGSTIGSTATDNDEEAPLGWRARCSMPQ